MTIYISSLADMPRLVRELDIRIEAREGMGPAVWETDPVYEPAVTGLHGYEPARYTRLGLDD